MPPSSTAASNCLAQGASSQTHNSYDVEAQHDLANDTASGPAEINQDRTASYCDRQMQTNREATACRDRKDSRSDYKEACMSEDQTEAVPNLSLDPSRHYRDAAVQVENIHLDDLYHLHYNQHSADVHSRYAQKLNHRIAENYPVALNICTSDTAVAKVSTGTESDQRQVTTVAPAVDSNHSGGPISGQQNAKLSAGGMACFPSRLETLVEEENIVDAPSGRLQNGIHVHRYPDQQISQRNDAQIQMPWLATSESATQTAEGVTSTSSQAMTYPQFPVSNQQNQMSMNGANIASMPTRNAMNSNSVGRVQQGQQTLANISKSQNIVPNKNHRQFRTVAVQLDTIEDDQPGPPHQQGKNVVLELSNSTPGAEKLNLLSLFMVLVEFRYRLDFDLYVELRVSALFCFIYSWQ